MEGTRLIFLLALLATGNCHLHKLLDGFAVGLKAGGIGGSFGVSSDSGRSGSYSGSGIYAQSSASSFSSSNSGSYSFGGSVNPGQHPINGNLAHAGSISAASGGAGGANNAGFGISGTIGFPQTQGIHTLGQASHAGIGALGSSPSVFGGTLTIGSNQNAGHSGSYAGASSGASSGSLGISLTDQQSQSKFPASGSYTGVSDIQQGHTQNGGAGGVLTVGVTSSANDANKFNTGGAVYSSHVGAPGPKTDSYGNPVGNEYFESHITNKPHSFASQEKIEHDTYKIPNNLHSTNVAGPATNTKIEIGSVSYGNGPTYSTTQQPSKLTVKPFYTNPSNVNYYPDTQPNSIFNMGINAGSSSSSVSGAQSGSTQMHYTGTFGGSPGILGEQKPGFAIKETHKITPGHQITMTVQNAGSGSYGSSNSFGVSGTYAGSGNNAGQHTIVPSPKPSDAPSKYTGGFGGGPGILGEQQKPGYAIKDTQATAAPGFQVSMTVPTLGFGSYSGTTGNVNTGQQSYVHGSKPTDAPSKYTGAFGGSPGILGEQKPGYAIKDTQVTSAPGFQVSMKVPGSYAGTAGNVNVGQHTYNVHSPKPSDTPSKYTGGFGGGPGILGEQKPGYAIKETQVTAAPVFQVSMAVPTVGFGSYGGSNSYAGSNAYAGSSSYAGAAGSVNAGQFTVAGSKPSVAPSKYTGGFGGSPGILGEQKPGFAVTVSGNKETGHANVVSTSGVTNKYVGSFGGAPGIITATGPATNYPSIKPATSSVLAGGFISAGNTKPVIGTQSVIYADKKVDRYAGSFGGAPGVITATGPASNYPGSQLSVGHGGSHGSNAGHLVVMSVQTPANSYSSYGSQSNAGSGVISGQIGSTVPAHENGVGIDIRGSHGNDNGVYKYQGSHSSSVSGASSSSVSGSASFGNTGFGYGGAGSHGVHGVKASGGLMGGLANGMLGGLSAIKTGLLGGSIGVGSHASSSAGAFSHAGGNHGKEFTFSIG